jgi:hypothetical protein
MTLNSDACTALARYLTFPELVRVACASKGLWDGSEEARAAGKKEFLMPKSIAREIARWLRAEYAKHRVACIVGQNCTRDGFTLLYDDMGTYSEFLEEWDPITRRLAEIHFSLKKHTVVVDISTVKRSAPVLLPHAAKTTFTQHPTLQSMRQALTFHVEFDLTARAYSRGNEIPRGLPPQGVFDCALGKLQELSPLH